jgi:membrane-associated phospholipid phosphatase
VIAATRILFGAHFPSDVLVGLIVGTTAGVFVSDTARIFGLIALRPTRVPPSDSPSWALRYASHQA